MCKALAILQLRIEMRMIKKYAQLVWMIFPLLFSCMSPTTRSRMLVGTADHSGGIVNVGSDVTLAAPGDFTVSNNHTTTEKYLTLQWKPVPEATGYRVYRAVFPHHGETADLPDKAFKLLTEISQPYPLPATMTYNHQIPEVPLRRYQYRITALRYWGESVFSNTITGNRKPVDSIEAARDMDYTMQFAQGRIPNFGSMGLDDTVLGRASGSYHYMSKINKSLSHFENYADFETILNGNPKMQITLRPMGVKMNGTISATGLYNAKITYNDLVGVLGGLTAGGSITIEYESHSPQSFSYEEAKKFMKTVATTADEVHPAPPRREWDESDPNYVRAVRRARTAAGQ